MIVLDRTKLVEIFVLCDDFVKKLRELPSYHAEFLAMEESQMSKSELMAIVVFYHYSGFRCMKWYYEAGVRGALRSYFPRAFSYSHFVNSMRLVYQELVLFLFLCCMRQPTEANYVDSKSLKVCHIKREKQHKVFADSAKKGKTSVGWFYGFKLHLLINQHGEMLNVLFTTGNKADNNPYVLLQLFKNFVGTVYGDRGYWSSIRNTLEKQGVQLIAKPKKNQQNAPKKLPIQKQYAKKRAIIESVFELLTHQFDIDHTRHRSQHNAVINLVAGLVAYHFLENKPTAQKLYPQDFNKIVLF